MPAHAPSTGKLPALRTNTAHLVATLRPRSTDKAAAICALDQQRGADYEDTMPHPISDKVLQEILRAFAWEDVALPSEDAVRELAAAAGRTDEAIKNAYTRAYQEGGGEGDPWEAVLNHVPE
jgi:hypothetical protein